MSGWEELTSGIISQTLGNLQQFMNRLEEGQGKTLVKYKKRR